MMQRFLAQRSVSMMGRVFVNRFPGNVASSRFSNLSDALTKEIVEESTNDEIDQEYLDTRKEVLKSFSLKETVGLSKVHLHRKFKQEEISVTFDIQDEAEDNSFDPDSFNDQDEGEDVEPEENFRISFDVLLSKGEGKEKLHFSCLAGENIEIRNLAVIAPGKEINDTESYSGPVYEYLDEGLRNSFIEYLEERKVDQDLAYFILQHSRQKEQKEYENWLKQLLAFVETK